MDLRSELENEATEEDWGELAPLAAASFIEARVERRRFSPAVAVIGSLLLALTAFLLVGIVLLWGIMDESEYAKRSPFAAVRWNETEPEVRLEDRWYKLVALDGVPAGEIVDFSRATYGELWQKRFEEDLVEVLSKMDHPPGDTVTLELLSISSAKRVLRQGVAMTRQNRQAIRAAAEARSQ